MTIRRDLPKKHMRLKKKGFNIRGLVGAFKKVAHQKPCELKTHKRCLGTTFKTMKGCYWCNISKQRLARTKIEQKGFKLKDTQSVVDFYRKHDQDRHIT